MPGTTRYSATFDRTYEEDDRAKPASPPNARRSRSQSWQANSGLDGRQYTPFANRSPAPRSSSSDNNPSKGTEYIPTRTAKTSVKAHNNPFQFVKVGTCPLYKKAEEQLKKVKEVKKPDVLKEEEEEWQTNLDSWKSRRRKMSEDVFRRQEELKLLELEEQIAAQVSQKKTKTFSEMVESRATRGRALSLCLLTSPLEFQNWEFENKSHKNGSCSFTDESGENSTVNSEDEGVSVRGRLGETSHNGNEMNHRTNGNAHIEQNGSKLDASNGECNKLSNNVQTKPKENSYIDSGLESISSSHRAGDTPDSGSDFSQDSNSSIDCDSPRTGVNLLEDFSSKSSQISEGLEITASLKLDEKGHDFGFTFLGGKDEGQVIISSILEGSKAESSDIHLGDRIITIDGCDVSSKKHIEIAALLQKGREKGQINLILLRSSSKSISGTNGFATTEKHNKVISKETLDTKTYEKSIESENEMYVDDFEEIKRQSELLALNKKTDTASKNAQAQTKENKSPNKDAISLKLLSENSTAPILKINESNSAVEDTDKNEQKTEINNENRPKNIVKVKRIRRKGVYALNVDSNQISQDGIPINSLFPLSPVTELPSPADETKTMCSSLSSKNTLTVSVTQNGISNEEKQNDTLTSANISVIQGENIVSPTLKSESSVSHSTNLKTAENVESKMQTNIESKTETAKDPSLSSKTTNSLTEKSKSVSTPKKVKSTKLKKEITSEKTTTSSENMKELTNPVLSNHVAAVKTVTQEKTSSELINNKLSNVGNDEENCTVSKSMGNTAVKNPSNASTDTTLNEIYSSKKQNSTFQTEKQEKTISKNETTVPPLAEENCNSSNEITDVLQPLKTLPEKDETFTTCPSSNKVRDLALKFGEKKSSFSSESPSSTKNAKPPKIFLSEKSKPSKLDSTKVKANSAQQISTVTAPVVKKTSLSSASSTSNMLTKNADKEIKTKTGKADSVVNPEKQPKIIAKNQTAPVSIKRDNSDGQVPLDSQPVVNKLLTSSVSNTSDSCSSNSLIKEIQSKKEKVTTAITQDKQAKTVAKNENKMCPLNRVINFYKSRK